MKNETKQTILQQWDDCEEDNPHKSTEWLIQMTAERASVITGLDIQYADVVDALQSRSVTK